MLEAMKMLQETKDFIQEIIDDLDLKIVEKEKEQDGIDVLFQAEQYQFVAGELEAYTNIQEAFCSILAKQEE